MRIFLIALLLFTPAIGFSASSRPTRRVQRIKRLERRIQKLQQQLNQLRKMVQKLKRTSTSRPTATKPPALTTGVSLELARHRKRIIRDLRYRVHFRLPKSPATPIQGKVTIQFRLLDATVPLYIDFQAPASSLKSSWVQGKPEQLRLVQEHIIVPAKLLHRGLNTVSLVFTAGDGPLNRRKGFLYTLFVPDKASIALPCFDQPDLKARFTLSLQIPSSWKAVANGAEVTRKTSGSHTLLHFAQTRKIPTYLFAFAAGEFSIASFTKGNRTIRIFHRESDPVKARRNTKAIAALHFQSLKWLERYTQIPYPYGKFDVIAVPAFQYGGMEHPAAILYRASRLILDSNATQRQLLSRASVIAHETAHMWFGNLVTMRWFNDVWMKEVFANFMAAKIMHPSFPRVNHPLNFFLSHYRWSYSIDRTAGTHPVRQHLKNLNDASSLYGAMIYAKAPIAMLHLENVVGQAKFRKGIRTYLKRYQHGNADWNELIQILDKEYPGNLRLWSRSWIERAGRPTIQVVYKLAGKGIQSIELLQQDPAGRNRIWPQRLHVVVGARSTLKTYSIFMNGPKATLPKAAYQPPPDFILPNGKGVAYGRFSLDFWSRRYLLKHLDRLPTAMLRAVAWSALWDSMLYNQATPQQLLKLATKTVLTEPNTLNAARMLRGIRVIFWRYLSKRSRKQIASQLEQVLWRGIQRSRSSRRKTSFFDTFRSIVTTQKGIRKLYKLWSGRISVSGLHLSGHRLMHTAYELAIRMPRKAQQILRQQIEKTRNIDGKRRIQYIQRVFSSNPKDRDGFFASLRKNRKNERWLLDGLYYLHHPLRSQSAIKYLRPSLDLLKQVKKTGSIFFPLRWLAANFSGHNSKQAAAVVAQFLKQHPNYPLRLKQKLQQAADPLFERRGSYMAGIPKPHLPLD